MWGCAAGTGLSCFADYLLGAHRCELAQVELGCAHTLLVRHEGRAVATRVEAHLVRVRVRVRVKARDRVRVRARVRVRVRVRGRVRGGLVLRHACSMHTVRLHWSCLLTTYYVLYCLLLRP